jgi:F-type H+-transporting ATPase subunit a
MPEQLWFTKILNHLFAGPVDALLHALSITPKYRVAPISNSFAMEVLVFFFLLILFLLVRSRLSVESPGGAFFILFCNLIGLVPGFESPTAVAIVPLGCALCAFVYYQYQGFKHAGFAYLKHFAGPMPALSPLMIPIELISHLARVLSLTIRLFANMFAGDMVTLVFFSLVPLGVPIIFLGLHVAVSLLQTYIFVLLTTVYLQGAVSDEH